MINPIVVVVVAAYLGVLGLIWRLWFAGRATDTQIE